MPKMIDIDATVGVHDTAVHPQPTDCLDRTYAPAWNMTKYFGVIQIMKNQLQVSIDLDELDLISTIWIIANNDENHLITFEGIRERLGLETSYDVKGRVLKYRELFRPGAPPGELEEWQDAMRNKKRLPTWINIIPTEPERLTAINNLSQQDVFRSQFRVNKNDPKSQVEILNWGLEHIDRLRKSRIAVSDANAKSWEIWFAVFVGILNIIVTLLR